MSSEQHSSEYARALGSQRRTALIATTVLAFVVAACLVVIWFAMRGVLDLGGFVAVGGPYEIAHPAPDWVWVLPLSIVTMMGSLFGHAFLANRIGGFTLFAPLWVVLFASLGYNFLEYGFDPPGGEGLGWGWLVSGAVFILMTLPMLRSVVTGRAFTQPSPMFSIGMSAPFSEEDTERFRRPYMVLHAVAVVLGGVAGAVLFGVVSS